MKMERMFSKMGTNMEKTTQISTMLEIRLSIIFLATGTPRDV
jgi:hypothetical protein